MQHDDQTAYADTLVDFGRGNVRAECGVHHPHGTPQGELPSLSLTFAVGSVCVELEASLTQAQERAVGVETLAPDAHVVLAAFIHI